MIKVTRYYCELPDGSARMCLVKTEVRGKVKWLFTRDVNEQLRDVTVKQVKQMVKAEWFKDVAI